MKSVTFISDSEKFRAIGKSADIGYLVVLNNGIFIEADKTASDWLELDRERPIGSYHIHSFIAQETAPWEEIVSETAKNEDKHQDFYLQKPNSSSGKIRCRPTIVKKDHKETYFILVMTMRTSREMNRESQQSSNPAEWTRGNHLSGRRAVSSKENDPVTANKRQIEALLKKNSIKLNTIAFVNSALIKQHWKEALQNSFEQIAETVDADRVYYFENSYSEKGKAITSLRLEWCRRGITPQIENPGNHGYSESDIPDLLRTLASNKPFTAHYSELADGQMKSIFAEQHIKSLLTIPVIVEHTFWGFIGFDDCRNERCWKEDEISFLTTISLNLASAIKNEEAKKEINRALIEKNRILESIDDGFFTVDRYWIVTYWNRRAEKILNIPRLKIVGKNLWDLFDEMGQTEFYSSLHSAILNQSKNQFEEYLPEIDSWLEFVIYPTDDGLSVYFKNINARKENEKMMNDLNLSLKAQTKELEISNAELEQFAYVASHDLQEPLRMITSFLNQIEKKYSDKLDDKGRQYIRFVTDGAQRMRRIILDLLEFSKIGSMHRDRRSVDMNEIFEKAVLFNKRLIERNRARVTSGKLPVIQASEIQMQQLLQNLVNNAVKYQHHGKEPLVHVNCKDDGPHWTFSMRDNGIGINPEYKSRIFEIFQRLHGTNEYSGTGIGLAICKKIVEEHRGNIWFESEIGKGSVFFFTIKKDQYSHP